MPIPAQTSIAEEPSVIRRIAHLDMDAFFASVELLSYPQLGSLPVVIGGSKRFHDHAFYERTAGMAPDTIPAALFPTLSNYSGRGVITTATYAARQYGIGSAMGIMAAAKILPTAILLPANFDAYKHYSKQFKHIVKSHCPIIENRGIDEIYIDFTDVQLNNISGQLNGGRDLAFILQEKIFQETGLTCSIGVAPNKLLAKMASEFNKPRGISILYEKDIKSIIWPLPCRKVNGIGPKSEKKLLSFNIQTIGDLAACEQLWLMQHFGRVYGAWLYNIARGIDNRALQTHSEPVSMSRETTFEEDLDPVLDKHRLNKAFKRLCTHVTADLSRKGYAAKTIGIKLRFKGFKTITRDRTFTTYTHDVQAIQHYAAIMLKHAPIDQQKIRLLGVKVSNLIKISELAESTQHPHQETLPLFTAND